MFLKQRFWIHIVAMGFIAILLAACGGESNSSTGPEKDAELVETSSSNVKCSSSEKKMSSSNQKTVSSSSADKVKSSSSVTPKSSCSSIKSSSSSKKVESSSSKDKTKDTLGWNKGNDGELRKGDSTETIYKYDEAQDKWLQATYRDSSLQLNGCTTNRTGEIGKSPTTEDYYICENSNWLYINIFDYDTYGETCTSAEVGKIIAGAVTSTNKYYCAANGWVSMTDNWSWDVPKEARLNPEITYDVMTDTRDKKVYKTVKIGDQVWMAENLNYADTVKTRILRYHSWCYDDVEENCDVSGRLYSWASAIDSAKLYAEKSIVCGYGKNCPLPDTVYGICPPGWHLPSKAEFETLFKYVGGIRDEEYTYRWHGAGIKLKSASGWYKNGNGTDDFGFSALPAGTRGYYSHSGVGRVAAFWYASESSLSNANFMKLEVQYTIEDANLYSSAKNEGRSVRCLKN